MPSKILSASRNHGRQRGFSLIEVMIAVAIVTILSAIAYPSYTRYVAKSNRSAAESFMLSVANKQEQYMLDKRQYTSTLSDLSTPPSEVSRNYTISITNVDNSASPPTYTITATPSGPQASRDATCGTLTFNQAQVKGQSGTGSVTDCW